MKSNCNLYDHTITMYISFEDSIIVDNDDSIIYIVLVM